MMKVLHSMEVLKDVEARTLTFNINLLAPSAIDQVKFVVLLETMFGGERIGIGRFSHLMDKPFGVVGLKFPSVARCQEAEAFCDAKLTRSGMMIAGDRGMLDKADPGTRVAASIMRDIYAQPFSDPPRVSEPPRRAVIGGAAPVH